MNCPYNPGFNVYSNMSPMQGPHGNLHANHALHWVPASHDRIPGGAVRAGTDLDGGPLYVIRAKHENDLIPGKANPMKGGAFVPWGGAEISKFQYEVLVSSRVAWKYTASSHDIPTEAVRAGYTSDGEALYVGRGLYQGVLTPGKIHPSHRCLYISWAGSEKSIRDFEVLISY